DFFRENSSNDRFSEIKNKFKQEALVEKELLKKRKKNVGPKKERLQAELGNFFSDLESGYYINEANKIAQFVESELNKTDDNWSDKEKHKFITEVRSYVYSKWKELDKKIKIIRPNIGLNKSIKRDWESYLKNREKITNEVIIPNKQSIEILISGYIEHNGISFSLRDRVT
ncbi:hypothetical protein EAY07_22580, partial [Vibrio anguillarum]|nr:hypothetical protein [Vibrio anguillarum]